MRIHNICLLLIVGCVGSTIESMEHSFVPAVCYPPSPPVLMRLGDSLPSVNEMVPSERESSGEDSVSSLEPDVHGRHYSDSTGSYSGTSSESDEERSISSETRDRQILYELYWLVYDDEKNDGSFVPIKQKLEEIDKLLQEGSKVSKAHYAAIEKLEKRRVAMAQSLQGTTHDGSNVGKVIDDHYAAIAGLKESRLATAESLASLEQSFKITRIITGIFIVCSTIFHLVGEQIKQLIWRAIDKKDKDSHLSFEEEAGI